MKRMNVMLSALALLLLSACSQNEVTEVSPDAHPQVGFGVYTGVIQTSTAVSVSWGILRDRTTLKP